MRGHLSRFGASFGGTGRSVAPCAKACLYDFLEGCSTAPSFEQEGYYSIMQNTWWDLILCKHNHALVYMFHMPWRPSVFRECKARLCAACRRLP